MTLPIPTNLIRARTLYYDLRLEEAYPLFKESFDELGIEECCAHVDFFSMFIRTLYELGKDQDLKNYRSKLALIPERKRTPELDYQVGLSYLTQDSGDLDRAREVFEKIPTKTEDVNLLARSKMGLATCLDILRSDWKLCDSIISSIELKGLDPYLVDLVAVWKAKISRDSGKIEEAERALGSFLATVKAHFHWHAYLSGQVILGGVYLRQERFDRLLSIIKEVRAYCDKYPLRTIKRQIDHLADQIKGKAATVPLIWEKRRTSSVLKYEGKSLQLTGDKPWQKLLLSLIREKVLPKQEIMKRLYQRNYRSKKDDKVIYGQLHILKKHLVKLGLSQKLVTKESFGYRWVPEVSEVEGDSQ
ncbi:hypothetical protein EBT16_11440 [bacterium]|nr:hypothetical protein [bacterium]